MLCPGECVAGPSHNSPAETSRAEALEMPHELLLLAVWTFGTLVQISLEGATLEQHKRFV